MKFLVGYDGSNASKDALVLSRSYGKAFDANIEIITSMEQGNPEDMGKIAKAKEGLQEAESYIADAGLTANTHLLIRGLRPGEEVVQFASENAVDAVFIGIKRRSKVGKLLYGSNAHYIILNAHCPVMTVK